MQTSHDTLPTEESLQDETQLRAKIAELKDNLAAKSLFLKNMHYGATDTSDQNDPSKQRLEIEKQIKEINDKLDMYSKALDRLLSEKKPSNDVISSDNPEEVTSKDNESELQPKRSYAQPIISLTPFPPMKPVLALSDTVVLPTKERENYKVIVDRGTFYQLKGAEKVEMDTSEGTSHSKTGYMAYVLNTKGQLFLFNHKNAEDRVTHATFAGDEPIIAAGEVKIVKGKLEVITGYSGHYKPDEFHVFNALNYLQNSEKYKVDLSNVTVKLKLELDENFGVKSVPEKKEEIDERQSVEMHAHLSSPDVVNKMFRTYKAEDLVNKVKSEITSEIKLNLFAHLQIIQAKIYRQEDVAHVITMEEAAQFATRLAKLKAEIIKLNTNEANLLESEKRINAELLKIEKEVEAKSIYKWNFETVKEEPLAEPAPKVDNRYGKEIKAEKEPDEVVFHHEPIEVVFHSDEPELESTEVVFHADEPEPSSPVPVSRHQIISLNNLQNKNSASSPTFKFSGEQKKEEVPEENVATRKRMGM